MKRLLAGVLLAGSLCAQERTTPAEVFNDRGLVHMRENRFVDAIADFRRAVQAKPDFVRAWNNLGSVLAQAGDMTESVAAFRKAVALSSSDVQLRMNLGIALRSKGDAIEAAKEFREVLKTRPGDPDVHHQLALTMKQAGDLESAISGFETVLGIHSEYREAYYNLATTLRQQAARTKRRRPDPLVEPQLATIRQMLARGDLQGAVKEIERLSEKMPDSPDVLNLKGFVQGQQRDLTASIETLKRAVEIAPDLAEARYNLGVALWYGGDRVNSWKQLDEAIRLNPGAPDVYAFSGMARREAGDLESARRLLQRAIALGPALPAPYIDLGLLFLRQDRPQNGIGQLEAGLNLPSSSGPIPDVDAVITELRRVLASSDSPEGRNTLGLLLGKQGADPKLVVAEFRQALKLRPGYAEAQNNLGLVLMQIGDSDGGIAAFRTALTHVPGFGPALGNLGAALIASSPDEAIDLLEKAVSAQPSFVRAQYNLALAYAQSEKHAPDKAVEQFRKVLELDNSFAAAHFEFGKLLFRRSSLDQAIASFREALRLDPNLGAARYQLGLALTRAGQKAEGANEIELSRSAIDEERKLTIAGQLMGEARAALQSGKNDEAITALQRVIALVPDYAPAREALNRALSPAAPPDDPSQVALFEAYIRNQQFNELEPLVNTYLKSNPNSWWAHYVLGYTYFGQRKVGESIRSLARSLELNVNNAEAHRILGRNLMLIGRFDAAQIELLMAIKLRPQSAEFHYDLGKIYSAQDNYPPAKRELEEATRLDPGHMEAYESLGFVMEALGEDAAALAHYKKSAEINESRNAGFASPYVSIAAYYNRTGDPKQAAENARKAVQFNSKSDGASFQLGKALDRLQQWPEAAEALQRAIELNPNAASYRYVLSAVYRRLGKTMESQEQMEMFRRLEKEAAEFERKRRESRQEQPKGMAGR